MPTDPTPGDVFHAEARPVYAAPLPPAIYKQARHMARVRYEATHLNAAEEGDRRGHGTNLATWVFGEEPGQAEGLFESSLELFIDARLEPGAAIGLHHHDRTEELYYMLEGELVMTTRLPGGSEHTCTLRPGDAHLVRRGEAHFGVAGPAGARFITVALGVDA